jgi:hypothetical protein
MKRITALILFILLCPSIMAASSRDVHWRLADSAFSDVLRECGATEGSDKWCLKSSKVCLHKKLWMGKTFGEIAYASVESDLSPSRLHQRGKTILEELGSLDSARLDAIIRANAGWEVPTQVRGTTSVSNLPSAEISGANVIANYLLHHLIALHYAERGGDKSPQDGSFIERGLIYEAIAQSYLVDAFSAGHLLLPVTDAFSFLHPRNNDEAQNYYNSEGVFVLNSRGDVWRTFGEELYEWYAPTFRHIFEACRTSLREVILAYYCSTESSTIPDSLNAWARSIAGDMPLRKLVDQWLSIRDAQQYYSSLKMPTLLLLPMPISATWSLRTEEVDTHGIHQRKQYPQIKESSSDPGFHDPYMLDVDDEFIYTRSSLPNWMTPEAWIPPDSLHGRSLKEMTQDQRTRLAGNLIKHDTNVASVRYMQERYYPPTYWGLLFCVGGGYFFNSAPSSGAWSAGLGYAPPLALLPDVPLFDRLSFDLAYVQLTETNPRQLLSLAGGLSLGLYTHRAGTRKRFRYLEYLRLEGGYAWGLSSPMKSHGAVLSFGLESGTIPLGFTYAGVSLRLKYQSFLMDRSLNSVSMEFVLQ